MKQYYLLLAILFSVTSSAFAQKWCGTTTTPEMEARLIDLRDNPRIGNRMPDFIPIRFHLVAESDGSGRIDENEILEQLCVLNNHFEDQNMQFFIKGGFNYVNNSQIYTDPRNSGFQMSVIRDPDALNVWCVQNAGGGPGIITLGYYDPSNDWVVMANNATVAGETEFTHELGHFFSLLHTHNGWDCEQYDESIHGNPVSVTSVPCGSFGIELQDGSNCISTGDFLCDTPPDYLFGLGWPGCTFTEAIMDPNGMVVDPDEQNYMSYFLNCDPDTYYFSDQQKAIIESDYNSSRRNYLRRVSPTHTELVEDQAELIAPEDASNLTTGNTAILSWNAVEHASRYLVQIDRTPSFSFMVQNFIVSDTELEIPDLDPNTNYFWRVKAYNQSSTCAPNSESRRFITGSIVSVDDEDLNREVEIYPNPVSRDVVFINTELQLDRISLQSTDGKVLASFDGSRQSINLPADLKSGIYILRMQSQDTEMVKKIIVNK